MVGFPSPRFRRGTPVDVEHVPARGVDTDGRAPLQIERAVDVVGDVVASVFNGDVVVSDIEIAVDSDDDVAIGSVEREVADDLGVAAEVIHPGPDRPGSDRPTPVESARGYTGLRAVVVVVGGCGDLIGDQRSRGREALSLDVVALTQFVILFPEWE